MPVTNRHTFLGLSVIAFLFMGSFPGFCEQLSISSEVKANISILKEKNECKGCNLSGANLNRFDLTAANLEGANLARARLYLTNLSGANLQNTDLREAQFGGADLSDANLRGANLAGTSFSGAYMSGALFDGEMLTTTPYAKDEISNIEEVVYVDDTVTSKALPKTKNMNVGSRRDFEETPPSVPADRDATQNEKQSPEIADVITAESIQDKSTDISLPEQSAIAPPVKHVPVLQEVKIPEKVGTENIAPEPITEDLSVEETKETNKQKTDIVIEAEPVEQAVVEQNYVQNEELKAAVEAPAEVSEQEVETGSEDEHSEVVAETSLQPMEGQKDTSENMKMPEDKDDAVSKETVTESKAKIAENEIEKDEGVVHRLLGIFSDTKPSSEIMRNVAVLLDTNQCYGCNLNGVNLSGEDLGNADLEGADLSNAVLNKVDFEGANLKGANLTGADLTGADLSEADMYKASLKGANLTNAKLEDTLLDDVDLSGVTGYQKAMMLMDKK